MSDTATATPATKSAFQVQADAQVVEDQAALDAAKTAAASAHAAKVKADSDAYDALQKAQDATDPVEAPTLVATAVLLQSVATKATEDEVAANKVLVAAKDKLVTSTKVAAGATFSDKSPWFYDASAKQASADFLDIGRFFQWEPPVDNPNACPERDGVQVNAIPVPARGVFPEEIQKVAARVAQK
jgi:hypothetical protein